MILKIYTYTERCYCCYICTVTTTRLFSQIAVARVLDVYVVLLFILSTKDPGRRNMPYRHEKENIPYKGRVKTVFSCLK